MNRSNRIPLTNQIISVSAVIMQKVGEERTRNTVVSTFWLQQDTIHEISSNGQTHDSELCGLGWQFVVEGRPDNVEIFFDPHLTRVPDSGLILSTWLSSSRRSTSLSHYGCRRCLLTTIDPTSIHWGSILVITVIFLGNIKLPTVSGFLRPNDMFLGTMSGPEFLDTKFYLFSSHIDSKRVGKHCAVFANSTILRQQSTYMDIREL
jgi:hypothetical protein